MDSPCNVVCPMPDVAEQAHTHPEGSLDWVGMESIEMPILFDGGDGDIQRASARVDAFVNMVHPDRRGIHMSRLYLLLDQHLGSNPVDAATLECLLHAFLQSHHDLSDRARIGVRFEHLVRRRALLSDNHGWRAYPVLLEASLGDEGFSLELGTEVVYSSTCPASAALSRQVIQRRFAGDFPPGNALDRAAVRAWLGSQHGISATPHAQRSVARLRVRFAEHAPLNLIALLDCAEQALCTAVQTVVKREDEQAFALANGANPMFCEDAARRIRSALDACNGIAGFHVRVEHQESLHPHNAVASVSRQAADSAAFRSRFAATKR